MSETRKPPKLIYLVSEDWYFVSHRLPLAIAAKEAGYDVVVATRVRKAGAEIRDAGLRLIPIDFERSRLSPLAELKTLAALIALYRREAPDLVHHVAVKPVLYGSIAARAARTQGVVNALMGLGFVFSSNSRKARVLKPFVSFFLRRCLSRSRTRTIVQNRDDYALLRDLHIAPGDTLRLIPGSGVDPDRYRANPPPQEAPPLVVLPSRLLKAKGVLEFAEAARRLKSSGLAARFALAGEPDPSNPDSISERELLAIQNGGAVEYLGWQRDMPKLLAEATVVCLPSYYGEGIPKVLIEAAASARAIVTTDMPGCREIVAPGVNGWLVPPRDAAALAAAIHEAISNPARCFEYGLRGREMVEASFSLQRVVRSTIEVYGELTPAAQPRPARV